MSLLLTNCNQGTPRRTIPHPHPASPPRPHGERRNYSRSPLDNAAAQPQHAYRVRRGCAHPRRVRRRRGGWRRPTPATTTRLRAPARRRRWRRAAIAGALGAARAQHAARTTIISPEIARNLAAFVTGTAAEEPQTRLALNACVRRPAAADVPPGVSPRCACTAGPACDRAEGQARGRARRRLLCCVPAAVHAATPAGARGEREAMARCGAACVVVAADAAGARAAACRKSWIMFLGLLFYVHELLPNGMRVPSVSHSMPEKQSLVASIDAKHSPSLGKG